MKNWQVISKNSLKLYEHPSAKPEGDEVKIKIDKVLLSRYDLLAYNGSLSANYPYTPGRFAMGRISDIGETGKKFDKNARVVLRSSNLDEENNVTIAGIDYSGYLRDFVCVDESRFFILPNFISDDDALILGTLALSEAIVEKLNAEKGDVILVSGESKHSIILCQLLLYYKIIPVLVEASEKLAALAKRCGVFYTFKPDENLDENVFEVTGGRLCNGAVYFNLSNKTPTSKILNLIIPKSPVVFAGQSDKALTVDTAIITKKQLSVSGVFSGYGFERTAINSLVNKAIDLSPFKKRYMKIDEVPDFYELAERTEYDEETLPIVIL